MTDDHDDRQLQTLLRRIEADVALDDAAADRALGRALHRYETEASTRALGPGRVHNLEALRADRRPERGTWLARAAAFVLLVGAVAAMAAWVLGRNEPDGVADQPPPSTGDGSTGEPSNVLGFEPFTTYQYDAIDPESQAFQAGVELRTGELTPDGDGTARLSIRQRGSRATEPIQPSEVFSFDVVVRDDGTVDVPLQFLDPDELGGRCTGGSVTIGRPESSPSSTTSEWSSTTTAECDGVTGEVTVTTITGAADDLALLAEPVNATPVTFVITPVDQRQRTVTLWFSSNGLVRHNVIVIGTSLDLDLDPRALIDMEES